MSESHAAPAGALHAFAAAVAHEIRTPLTAVAGEVEIALRRDRSPAEYRDALRRIAAGISELVEISADLTLLSAPAERPISTSVSASLEAILRQIRQRYLGRDDVTIASDHAAGVQVDGDQARLGRAITLIVEHAIRHRKGDAPVSVRVAALTPSHIRLVVEADPSGFWPGAWSSLVEDPEHAASPLRLRTARRILERSGGALLVACPSETDVVHIELPLSR